MTDIQAKAAELMQIKNMNDLHGNCELRDLEGQACKIFRHLIIPWITFSTRYNYIFVSCFVFIVECWQLDLHVY